MAIITTWEEGIARIEIGEFRPVTEQEEKFAYAVDKDLSHGIKAAIALEKDEVQAKNKTAWYWEIGKVLRMVSEKHEVFKLSQPHLFFKAARYHIDQESQDFPSDNLKKRRIIPEQLWHLAGYPKEFAIEVGWSQWSYLFDNRQLMKCQSFEHFFQTEVRDSRIRFNEGFIRFYVECLNTLFNQIETEDWNEEEKLRWYKAIFLFYLRTLEFTQLDRANRKIIKERVKSWLDTNLNLTISLLANQSSVETYSIELFNGVFMDASMDP